MLYAMFASFQSGRSDKQNPSIRAANHWHVVPKTNPISPFLNFLKSREKFEPGNAKLFMIRTWCQPLPRRLCREQKSPIRMVYFCGEKTQFTLPPNTLCTSHSLSSFSFCFVLVSILFFKPLRSNCYLHPLSDPEITYVKKTPWGPSAAQHAFWEVWTNSDRGWRNNVNTAFKHPQHLQKCGRKFIRH